MIPKNAIFCHNVCEIHRSASYVAICDPPLNVRATYAMTLLRKYHCNVEYPRQF